MNGSGFTSSTMGHGNMPLASDESQASSLASSYRRDDVTPGELYRLHGFRILDADGVRVGWVDWIWSYNATGHGEFIGLGLYFLRGRARAVPAAGAHVDWASSTIRLAYRKDTIVRAARFSIARSLTVREKAGIHSHYNAMPTRLSAAVMAEAQAA